MKTRWVFIDNKSALCLCLDRCIYMSWPTEVYRHICLSFSTIFHMWCMSCTRCFSARRGCRERLFKLLKYSWPSTSLALFLWMVMNEAFPQQDCRSLGAFSIRSLVDYWELRLVTWMTTRLSRSSESSGQINVPKQCWKPGVWFTQKVVISFINRPIVTCHSVGWSRCCLYIFNQWKCDTKAQIIIFFFTDPLDIWTPSYTSNDALSVFVLLAAHPCRSQQSVRLYFLLLWTSKLRPWHLKEPVP